MKSIDIQWPERLKAAPTVSFTAPTGSIVAPTKVLYIAGLGRSGSTLVGQILANTPGFVHVGELNHLWEHNVLGGRSCGCGREFAQCEFWNVVFDEAFGGVSPELARAMIAAQGGARTRHTLQMVRPRTRARLIGRMAEFLAQMSSLYASIARTAGAQIVVDSSKLPSLGFFVGQAPGVELRALHLVRDPRATAYSWSRRSHQNAQADHPEEPPLPKVRPARAALTWSAWNLATEWLWRGTNQRLALRYEDFAAEPRLALERVVAFAGVPDAQLPFVDDRKVEIARSHTAAGNPMRFDIGQVEVRRHDEWVGKLERAPFAAVSTIAYPVMRRYHYRLRRPDEPSP